MRRARRPKQPGCGLAPAWRPATGGKGPSLRRHLILDALRRKGKVLASALSVSLNVSEDTIRRDLRELDEAGLLQRVHGGALPRSGGRASFNARQEQVPAAKEAIARAAAQLSQCSEVLTPLWRPIRPLLA